MPKLNHTYRFGGHNPEECAACEQEKALARIGPDLREKFGPFAHPDLRGKLGAPVGCHILRRAMGLNPGKLPLDRGYEQLIGDTLVYVLDRTQAAVRTAEQHHGVPSHRSHRVFAVCNHCKKHIPAGRFGQHLKIHKEVA